MDQNNLSPDQFVYHHTSVRNRGSIERWGLFPRGQAASKRGDVGSHTGLNWFDSDTPQSVGPNTDVWKARVRDIPGAHVETDHSLDTPRPVVMTNARVRNVERHNG